MITSRLTSKAQTTIPQPVRAALGLRAGDKVGYVIEQGQVVLKRVPPPTEQDDPFAAFSDWGSAADEQACGGL